MFYPNDKTVLEASDIVAAYRLPGASELVTLPNGLQAIPLLLAISPHAGKMYAEGEFPTAFFVTSGVRNDFLVIAPEPEPEPEPEYDAGGEHDAGPAVVAPDATPEETAPEATTPPEAVEADVPPASA